MARQRYLMKKAMDAASRLSIGDQAYQKGDIRIASRMYLSVANARPATPVNQMARQRLSTLTAEARQKLKEVDDQLAAAAAKFGTSERLGLEGPLPREWELAVTTAFSEYDILREKYNGVPTVRRELRTRLTKKRNQPEYAASLNNPEAEALCEIARQHQRDQQQCCAYWVYKEAAKLTPAPAARTAAEQLAIMEKNEQLMQEAKKCRELKECHKLFNRAESVVKTWPARAKELLAQIIETAPPDSEIYRAARERVQEISDG
jgi:hypothetical protein